LNEKQDAEQSAVTSNCRFCNKPISFDEDKTIYKDACESCAATKYPLAFEVRKKILKYKNPQAARDVFGPEHDGCVPDSMLGDELLIDIMILFKAIGRTIAESAGMGKNHIVIVEPSYEDATLWMIFKTWGEIDLPYPGKSQVVFYDDVKAWHLGGNQSESEVEELLQSMKTQLQDGIESTDKIEHFFKAIDGVKIELLKKVK
jgi:hypothetical protein